MHKVPTPKGVVAYRLTGNVQCAGLQVKPLAPAAGVHFVIILFRWCALVPRATTGYKL